MAAGNSPIVEAIARAETGTTGEIRVHLSKRWFEKDPLGRAMQLFEQFGMFRTTRRNAVILYVNLRKRRMAIFGDTGIHDKVGQAFWEKILAELAHDLRTTHHEKAVAEAIFKIGDVLKAHFPIGAGDDNMDELPNTVTTD